ncbi:lamin tail domain-containing protein [Longimicrobium terrae]|uniref:LTD domain-containing protein n=1 Tax=Longimicrobium terrae TaxID=1639882 RepID=A0A841GZM7_9BACT|nr:lamin tail domain-containing protein [Longimicrobium terrae]MBB4636871.1 hypothetical protein [Longimicrobium terrae]MBB6071129.1 hypothetical protein [Longimicrobium terrae]NNC29178.1 lamin tail domain-containing protein [Longimicrobium terrae]
MRTPQLSLFRPLRMAAALLGICTLAGCGDGQPVASEAPRATALSPRVLQEFDCTASVTAGVRCAPARGSAGGASATIIGNSGVFVQLASSNVSYDTLTEILQFDVTVKNLMNEALGSPNGVVADPDGIRVFFHSGPTPTSGTGVVSVDNPDGYGDFTAMNQPYFTYHEILLKNAVSSPRPWRFHIPRGVTATFGVYVETDVQYLLVINEVLANPGGAITDSNGEWFEIYNAGSLAVNLQNLVIADSATAGRRPYHRIPSSFWVRAGGYAVLGGSADTLLNGGVPVDYAYGSALALANSLDAIKIARVYGTDTLTVDRAAYLSAAISAQNGISRELKNPLLDNSNIDGANWADAAISAVYGPGGRGTPKAQNSAFVP